MTSSEQPKEYTITEEEVEIIESHLDNKHCQKCPYEGGGVKSGIKSFIRSRPHPAPAFKRCCDSCINVPCKVLNRIPCLAQEKQENACEENGCTDIENCDEICQHSRIFSQLQMQEAKAEAARKAREDVLLEKLKIADSLIERFNKPNLDDMQTGFLNGLLYARSKI